MKYELTEKKTIGKTTLYRIRALKDFSNIKAGDLGGWIESERNLSQNGDAWVYDNAQVSGDAQVFGNALVFGDAWVYDNVQVFGDARVYSKAQVSGDAQVSGKARVSGDALVSGNARVSGDARVFGDAWVSGNARVSGDARVNRSFDYLLIGPIGSREAFTTFYRSEQGISVSCGCFNGTLEQFAYKVEKTHGDNQHGKAYKAAIEFVKQVMG